MRSWLKQTMATLAFTATAVAAQAVPAAAATGDNDSNTSNNSYYQGIRHFKNKATGRCLQAGKVAVFDGVCEAGKRDQLWGPVYVAKDGNDIVLLVNQETGLCLSNTASSAAGFAVTGCRPTGQGWRSPDQEWKAQGTNWSDVILVSYRSLLLTEVPGHSQVPSCVSGKNRVELADCNTGSAYHHWSSVRV
ncbi:hypothetical protein ACQEVZ_39410 [Dactylosporangium sp. CA-152071]|uniref:hypothetical protein n=1 Tax=Dactylosporangium sp. CA-152071 TaxID=3239933 RepID=UPI003D8D4718